jgi:hypothetical protein
MRKNNCLTCGKEFFIRNRKKVYCCKQCYYQKHKKDWFEGYEDKQHVLKKVEGEVGQLELEEIHLPEEIYREVMEKDDLAKNSYAIDPDITNAYDELNKTLHMGRYYKRKT